MSLGVASFFIVCLCDVRIPCFLKKIDLTLKFSLWISYKLFSLFNGYWNFQVFYIILGFASIFP